MTVSVGLGAAKIDDEDFDASLTLQLDVGVRVSRNVTLGVHVGIAPASPQTDVVLKSMFDEFHEYLVTPIHIGVMSQLELGDLWIEPWIGVQNALRVEACNTLYDKRVPGGQWTTTCGWGSTTYDWTPQLAGGLIAGYDVWRRGDKRVRLFASVAFAQAQENYEITMTYDGDSLADAYLGIWTGVGYGF